MVTLFSAPSNRLCHSTSSARVKGDPTSRYNVDDAFIKGCAPQLSQLLTQKESFQHRAHMSPSANIFCSRNATLLWHFKIQKRLQLLLLGRDLCLTVLSVSNRIKRVSPCMSLSNPFCSILWDFETGAVAHSPPHWFWWLQLSRPPPPTPTKEKNIARVCLCRRQGVIYQ